MTRIATPPRDSRQRPNASSPELETGRAKHGVGAHYHESGAGMGVVCLHASASSSGQWRPLMDRLSDRFHLLAADLYGSGHSPAWSGVRPMCLADEVALLAPVLQAAGPRFHLIGHSYGAAVALKAALIDPGRVESLVVYEPVLFSLLVAEDPTQAAAREIAAVRDDTIGAVQAGNPGASGARFVDYWMGPGAWAAMPEARRETIAAQMGQVKSQWHALFMEPAPLSAFAELEVPILYLTGGASPASSRGVARLLTKTLPRVTAVEIEGSGHMAPLTHPEKVNAAIEDFLERM